MWAELFEVTRNFTLITEGQFIIITSNERASQQDLALLSELPPAHNPMRTHIFQPIHTHI